MSNLRQEHEIKLQNKIKELRKLQIEEAESNLESIKESIELTKIKLEYYNSKEFMNAGEVVAIGTGPGGRYITIKGEGGIIRSLSEAKMVKLRKHLA